jgi:hypothetical protein
MNTTLSNNGMQHSQPNTVQKLASANEQTWITFGKIRILKQNVGFY